MRKIAMSAACLLTAFTLQAPAPAQEAGDDLLKHLVNVPAPSAYRVDGLKTKPNVRSDAGVQGGKALRISVPGKAPNAWAVAAANAIEKPVKAGDTLIVAFWARLEKGEGGATGSVLPYNAVQLASAPYTPLFSAPVTIGPEWKLHEVKGKADKDYAGGTLNVSIHLATAKQVVDLGPMFVLNMGPGK